MIMPRDFLTERAKPKMNFQLTRYIHPYQLSEYTSLLDRDGIAYEVRKKDGMVAVFRNYEKPKCDTKKF